MRLPDQVVLVTGGTAGIGLEVARRAIEEGAQVVITGRDALRGQRAVQQLGGRATYMAQDVTAEEGWTEVVDAVVRAFGRLTVLVNNAGWADSGNPQDPEELSYRDWREIMTTNLDSVFLGCRAAIPAMRETGGSIVNMSSTAGLMSTPSFVAYGAAKAAVAQFTKSIAVYCARRRYGIRCNSVHPALVDTELADQILRLFGGGEAARDGYLARVPMGELGTPRDVAEAVVYLASDESRYVTGAQLTVTGGLGA